MSSLEKCLFKSLPPFSNWVFLGFCYWIVWVSYIFLDLSPLSHIWFANIFPQPIGCLFTLLILLCKRCLVWYQAQFVQLFLTLCDHMDHSPPGSSVHGTIPARILDQVAISSSKRSSRSKEQTCWLGFPAASALTGGFFNTEAPGKPLSLMWSHLFCLFACDCDFILSLAQPMSSLFFSEKKST